MFVVSLMYYRCIYFLYNCINSCMFLITHYNILSVYYINCDIPCFFVDTCLILYSLYLRYTFRGIVRYCQIPARIVMVIL